MAGLEAVEGPGCIVHVGLAKELLDFGSARECIA